MTALILTGLLGVIAGFIARAAVTVKLNQSK